MRDSLKNATEVFSYLKENAILRGYSDKLRVFRQIGSFRNDTFFSNVTFYVRYTERIVSLKDLKT